MSEQILIKPHFHDLIDTPHLIDENERLPGADGTPGKGLTLREAIPLAELWWERTARFQMPDFGKDPHKQVVKSGVMMGLPWMQLQKSEMIRILAQWYAHVGIHTIVGTDEGSEGGKMKVLDDIRKDAAGLLPVLDTASTHNPDNVEPETDEEKELII